MCSFAQLMHIHEILHFFIRQYANAGVHFCSGKIHY